MGFLARGDLKTTGTKGACRMMMMMMMITMMIIIIMILMLLLMMMMVMMIGVVVKTMIPFLGTLNIRCRIIIGIQKGAIILPTTHRALAVSAAEHL